MEPSTPNINDISAIIRQKERELHDIHERRCLQLEKAIEEREKSHIDISKKFSQLRDDFKYNLSLLEARDSEIRRLEAVSNTLNGHVQTLQAEKSGLMHRLDNLQSREQERKDRAKGDAVLQKQMLLELQQEVEAVKWTTAEEIKAKQGELDKCKEDIRRMHLERDTSLSLQRRDMTSAFELLVSQRESSFVQREQEIVVQIASLEKRVESAQTENMRLKSDLSETCRLRDKLSLDIERKDESIRQLQWKIEDSNEQWKRKEDILERSLHEALNEVNLCRDSLIKQIGDSQLEIDRVRMDVRRERDLREAAEEKNKEMRAMLEERLKEVRAAAEERVKLMGLSTEDRVSELKKEHIRENDRLTSQVLAYDEIIRRLKDQLSAAESQASKDKLDHVSTVQALNETIHNNKIALDTNKEEISALEKQLKSSMDSSTKRIGEMEAVQVLREQEHSKIVTELKARVLQLEGQVADMRINQSSELELHKAAMDAEQILYNEEHESSRFGLHLQELQSRVMAVSSERDRLRAELQDFKAQLEEQTMECSALRLRLQLNESNFGTSQQSQGINRYQRNNLVHPNALSPKFRQEDNNSAGRMDYPSPLFTEDQGSISLPGSPDGRYLNSGPPSRYNNEDRHGNEYRDLPGEYDGREGFYPSVNSRVPPLHGSAAPAGSTRRYIDPNSHSDNLAKLTEDNNRLREVIKEMRKEIEMLPASHVGLSYEDDNKDQIISQQRDRISDLENQLGQSLKEIARLRAEKKKLMDVGNELRASLFQLQSDMDSLPQRHINPPVESADLHSYSDRGAKYGVEKFSAVRPSQKSLHGYPVESAIMSNPWVRPDNYGEQAYPPVASTRNNGSEALSEAPHQQSDSIDEKYGSRVREGDGLEGEPLALAALPLPPTRYASNKTTDSQKRVLLRLKQSQMRSQEPRKVMNYSSSVQS